MRSTTYDISGEWLDRLNEECYVMANGMDPDDRVTVRVDDPVNNDNKCPSGTFEVVQIQVVDDLISFYLHGDETDGPTCVPVGEPVKFKALGIEWLGEVSALHFESPGMSISVKPIAGREAISE